MAQKYTTPNWDKDSFTCPHCNTLSLMHFLRVNYSEMDYGFANKKDNRCDSWVGIATCYNCKKKIIWVNNHYVYPDITAEEANPDMPESVKQSITKRDE